MRFSKAVKADDAEVPIHLWNDRIFSSTGDVCDDKSQPPSEERRIEAANRLREWGLRIYRRNLLQDCLKRLRKKFKKKIKLRDDKGKVVRNSYGMPKRTTVPWWDTNHFPRKKANGQPTEIAVEMYAMSNILWHASEATWFEYPSGSHLHYLRFPAIYQQIARDGVRVYFEEQGPTSKEKQPEFADNQKAAVTLKSLIKYFAVPKGENDLRIVYDASRNGLNSAVWAPSFWLPTIDSVTRALDSDSFMMDCDVGEQFLNFPLHKDVWALHWC